MKGKYIVISIIITIILFFVLGYVEKKVMNVDSMKKAFVVKQNIIIDRYEKLDASMFESKNVPSSLAINSISDLKEIEGKYALAKMYSGDVLRLEKLGMKSDANLIEVEPNMRKLAISVGSLADNVAGQIRKNSYVDILFTNNPTSREPNISTKTVLQKVKVLGVTDSNGALIDGINSGKISSVILSVTPEEAHLLVNKERKGKFTLIEVQESSQKYENIVKK